MHGGQSEMWLTTGPQYAGLQRSYSQDQLDKCYHRRQSSMKGFFEDPFPCFVGIPKLVFIFFAGPLPSADAFEIPSSGEPVTEASGANYMVLLTETS